jgi:hypothetical protein
MGSLAALQGCGGDDDDEGTGGGGGSSGSKATGGTGTGGKATGGTGTGGKATGGTGTGGKATGGTGTGGTATGGTATGGAGGAPGGAGGEGGGSDGTRAAACTDYCQAFEDAMCRTFQTNTYDDEADCRDVCNASDWAIGDEGDASGNSINCRLTHAGLADANPAMRMLHCGHASEVSTNDQCS